MCFGIKPRATVTRVQITDLLLKSMLNTQVNKRRMDTKTGKIPEDSS